MLTRRQQQTLEFLRNYIAEHQQAPTEAEIAAGIGIKSRGVAHRYVAAIEQAGYIKTIPGKRRNIRLRHNYKNQILGLPLIGSLYKNKPIKAAPKKNIFNLDHEMLKPNRFLLQIADDSLHHCGIFEHDFVVCELKHDAKDEDIVIAIVNSKMTLLRTLHCYEDGSVGLSDPYTKTNLTIYRYNEVRVHAIYRALIRIHQEES